MYLYSKYKDIYRWIFAMQKLVGIMFHVFCFLDIYTYSILDIGEQDTEHKALPAKPERLKKRFRPRTDDAVDVSDTPTTVDGRNPAPVEVGSLSHYLQGFIHPRWCRISSINSITTQCKYIVG